LRTAPFMILFVIMVSSLVVPSYASNISITIDNNQVKARFDLSLQQNMTQFPSQTTTLTMASDGKLASAFTQALNRTLSGATLSDLSLNLKSTPTSLNITTTITVTGVSGRNGDILSSNLGWKAFNVSSDLRAGDLSYNTVGNRYLRPVTEFYTNASLYVGKPNSTITGVNFLVNKTSVSGYTAEDYVGNFTLFDFRSLGLPLQAWNRTYSLSNDTTIWRYAPAQPLNISVEIQRLNQTTTIAASYGFQAEVSVPGIARARGETILIDVGTGQKEWVMSGIVAFTVILGIIALLAFRARSRRYAKFGRR
jgi:hypothetical protein